MTSSEPDDVLSSSSDSSSSSSSSSESETSSSDDSSSGEEKRRGRGGKGRRARVKRGKLDWELLEELWPAEDRPKALQSRKSVVKQGLSMAELMDMKEQFMKEQERKGVGAAVFGRDRKPKKMKFKAMKDDGERKLHPARFVGLPRVEPKLYWEQVPVATKDIYRHVPLQHIGVEGLAENTVVKMHNRKVPVELDSMLREVKDCKQVQVAVYNYVASLRSLHPMDFSGLVMLRVLIEASWADGLGNEKQRVGVMKQFFDEMVSENSGRAVRREVPMDFEMAKKKWEKVVASYFPQLSVFNYGQVQQLRQGQQQGGGAGVKQESAQRGGGKAAAATGGGTRTRAQYNGLGVCYPFNSKEGCKRAAQGPMACKDGSNVYAHVCNFWFRETATQPGRHCLAQHSRAANH